MESLQDLQNKPKRVLIKLIAHLMEKVNHWMYKSGNYAEQNERLTKSQLRMAEQLAESVKKNHSLYLENLQLRSSYDQSKHENEILQRQIDAKAPPKHFKHTIMTVIRNIDDNDLKDNG